MMLSPVVLGVVVLLAAVVGGLSGGWLARRMPYRNIVTDQVTIVDRHGVARATIGVTPSGDAGLALMDVQGQVRVLLGAGANANFTLHDAEGNPVFGAVHNEAAGAFLLDVDGADGNVKLDRIQQ